jgi:NADPH-dependent 7-cyano-7-deazaguanine reductase QueF
MFAETLSSIIAHDVADTTQAAFVKVTLIQQVRGGLCLEVVAEVGQE